ncbi:MAG: cytochrome P450, partial [Pseudomonadota bacterium]
MAYDLSSPEFLANPGPTLAAMRAKGALVQVKLPFVGLTWMTTTDAAARQLLKSPELFGRDPLQGTGKTLAQKYWYFPPFVKLLFQNMLGFDGAEHVRLRGLVELAFNKTSIDDMRPRLTQIADGLLDGINPSQPVDIILAYTRPLPLMAICDLLGVPQGDRSQVARWIGPLSGPTNAWGMARGLPGLWRIMRYFRADFDRVRRNPRPGLITDLVQAEAAGDRLS